MDTNVILTFIGIAVAIAAAVYLGGSKLLGKKPGQGGDLKRVEDVTKAYFKESDVEAKVNCVIVEGKGLVALIEVDPQVRFRSSYIIEQTLREQIQRLTGKSLVQVFWRFPMIEKLADTTHAGPAFVAAKGKVADPHYDIGEVSWDEYERAIKGESVSQDVG